MVWESLHSILKIILDKLDLSLSLVYHLVGLGYRHISLVIGLCGFVAGGYLLKLGWNKLMGKSTSGSDENIVKYLLSSSAQHINTALSLRNSNKLQALEHAIYGSVMAKTSKDIVDNKRLLSKNLGVDVYAYLDYTNKVLTKIKDSLQR